jgi:hypothetical protein
MGGPATGACPAAAVVGGALAALLDDEEVARRGLVEMTGEI